VARRRARCQESVNAGVANGQVSDQAEADGQEEELTKVLSLTILSVAASAGGSSDRMMDRRAASECICDGIRCEAPQRIWLDGHGHRAQHSGQKGLSRRSRLINVLDMLQDPAAPCCIRWAAYPVTEF
jgi:hypothetical protein